MRISTEEASKILDVTPDELLFMAHTEKKISVGIDEEMMTWVFRLEDVLSLKDELDAVKLDDEEE